MATPPWCRHHAEHPTPGKLTFGGKLAVVLIQQIGWFGGRSLDECGGFLDFRVPIIQK